MKRNGEKMAQSPRLRTSPEFANLVKTLKKNMKFRSDVTTTDYIGKMFIRAMTPKWTFAPTMRRRKSILEPL